MHSGQILVKALLGIHRRTGAPEIEEELLHGLHIVSLNQIGGIVAFHLGADRVKITDVLTQRVNLGDIADKCIGNVHAREVGNVIGNAWVAALEEPTLGANQGVATVMHLDNKVIVTRRQIFDIDGVEQHIDLVHIVAFVVGIVLHTVRRFDRLYVIAHQKLAFVVQLVAVVELDIKVQLVLL